VEPPDGELPDGELLDGVPPSGELSADELPGGELPGGELSVGDLPVGEPPSGELLGKKLPVGELPAEESPDGELLDGEFIGRVYGIRSTSQNATNTSVASFLSFKTSAKSTANFSLSSSDNLPDIVYWLFTLSRSVFVRVYRR
jgi:hypothetical protein